MAELQVKDIENGNILPTDKVYAFSEDESKAPTVDALVKSTPGIIALGVCKTEAAEGYKQVTSPNWKGVPGESILIEFEKTNSAKAVYISINEGTALPVYPLNSNVIAAGSVIHSGAMLFTLSSDGTKLWAIVIALKTFDNQELAGSGNIDLGYYLDPIVNSIPTKVSELQNDSGFITDTGNVETATNATHADSADYATSADSATNASYASSADNADKLDGLNSLWFMHERTGDMGTTAQFQEEIVNNGSAGPCCGSYQITDGPLGDTWYNYMYIPHRNGIAIGNDNHLYGTLIVFPMILNINRMFMCHRIYGGWNGWMEIHAGTATIADRVRIGAPSNPVDGDTWIE